MQTKKTEREKYNAHFAGHNTPSRFNERIGSTTYRVSIRFPEKETERLEEKIMRLIKNDLHYEPNNGTMLL